MMTHPSKVWRQHLAWIHGRLHARYLGHFDICCEKSAVLQGFLKCQLDHFLYKTSQVESQKICITLAYIKAGTVTFEIVLKCVVFVSIPKGSRETIMILGFLTVQNFLYLGILIQDRCLQNDLGIYVTFLCLILPGLVGVFFCLVSVLAQTDLISAVFPTVASWKIFFICLN